MAGSLRQICRLLAAVLFAASCARPGANRPGIADADVREYLRLVGALASRDADSLDYAYAAPGWEVDRPAEPPPFPAIRSAALALAERLEGATGPAASDETQRRRHLTRQARALAARVDVLTGPRAPFDRESERLFGIAAPPPDNAAADRIREQLAGVLPGTGTLPARYARFTERLLVPPARQAAVLARAIEECRRRTVAQVEPPREEHVDLADVDNSPWLAYSRYKGQFRTVLELQKGARLTPDATLALACHETYPGHHLQNVLVEQRLVRGRGWREFTAQPLFSPQMLLAEGAAEHAIDVAFPAAEREAFERDVLFPAAGLDPDLVAAHVAIERLVARLAGEQTAVARAYVDGDLEFARAAAALVERTLTPQPDALLKFFNEYRTFAVTYSAGAERVRSALAKRAAPSDAAAAWRAYLALITQPWHDISSPDPFD